MPEKRLNSDVFPAPFGPMIPRSSPFATSRLTSTTILAPPMSSPRLRVARIGGFIRSGAARLLLERRDGRLDVARRDDLRHLGDEVTALPGDELCLEHRLDHRVVGRADELLALGRLELPALERTDLLRRVGAALLQRPADHERRVEAVRREEVRHAELVLRVPLDQVG